MVWSGTLVLLITIVFGIMITIVLILFRIMAWTYLNDLVFAFIINSYIREIEAKELRKSAY